MLKRWLQNIAIATTIVVAIAVLGSGTALSDAALEYRVKAAFLYNFAKFVNWPDSAFSSVDEPLGVCVLGTDPFGAVLDKSLEGRTAHGRNLLIRRGSDLAALGRCHVLFVGTVAHEPLARIMQRVGGSGALTVGETHGFFDLGGIIRLDVEDGKVRFDVNAGRADEAGLRVSSQLLKLARDVSR